MPDEFSAPLPPVNPQTVPPELEVTPPLPVRPAKSNSIFPMLLGVIVVLILAAVFGGSYYLSKLKKEIAASPTPLATATPTPTPEPSLEPSLEPSPSASVKASKKPLSSPTAKPSPTPTSTPSVTLPNLDIRFGNPAANVKQTIDEGAGDGRVINREYTSIQVGEFDEVRAAYSPRVTVCFHVVSNEVVAGEKVGYTMTLDDKTLTEGTLSRFDKLEAGRLYDLCQDISTDLGTHVVKLNINNTKSLAEANFNNNFARLEYQNLMDKIAPNYTLGGPYNWNDNGTCFIIVAAPTDNVTETSKLKVEQKVDGGSWEPVVDARYCFKGTSGSSHTYTVSVSDARGNKNEQTQAFKLF